MILYLLESFNNSYAEQDLNAALLDDKNRLRYLTLSVSRWTGSFVDYEVQNDYQKYLTERQVTDAINNLIENKGLFDLDFDTQCAAAAFWLDRQGNTNYHNHIPQDMVDVLITD